MWPEMATSLISRALSKNNLDNFATTYPNYGILVSVFVSIDYITCIFVHLVIHLLWCIYAWSIWEINL